MSEIERRLKPIAHLLQEGHRPSNSIHTLSAGCIATSFDPAAHGILEDVQTMLLSDFRSLTAHLQQLAVFGPGQSVSSLRQARQMPGSGDMQGVQ